MGRNKKGKERIDFVRFVRWTFFIFHSSVLKIWTFEIALEIFSKRDYWMGVFENTSWLALNTPFITSWAFAFMCSGITNLRVFFLSLLLHLPSWGSLLWWDLLGLVVGWTGIDGHGIWGYGK